jgi:flagellar hook-length control protein FliK
MGRARAASGEPGVSWSTSASTGVPLIGATLGNSAQTAIAPGVGGVLSVGGVSALQAGGPVNPVFARQAFAALASEPNAGLDALEPVSEPGHFEGMLSEQMTQAMSEGAETSGHGHHSGGHRTASSLVEPLSVGGDESAQGASGDADERQAMTQRLAEGLAQRISAQIAQNNWKLQVELRPAHLGQVNIELAMNGGQLEARFDATQVGARAMIQEGLDRLRQDLERSGMNVAYLGMQAGGGSSGGGKPTLRSRSGETAQAGQTEAIREPALSERSSRVGRDGLDVMV